MTINEAFTLRDQFGWKPAPDDRCFFITAVSGGEKDGSIGVDPDDRSVKCRQRVEHMESALPCQHGIGGTHRVIDVVIEPPAMLDLTEAEQRYVDEGGRL